MVKKSSKVTERRSVLILREACRRATGPGSVKPASPEVIAVVKTAIDLLGTMTAGPAKEVSQMPDMGRAGASAR